MRTGSGSPRSGTPHASCGSNARPLAWLLWWGDCIMHSLPLLTPCLGPRPCWAAACAVRVQGIKHRHRQRLGVPPIQSGDLPPVWADGRDLGSQRALPRLVVCRHGSCACAACLAARHELACCITPQVCTCTSSSCCPLYCFCTAGYAQGERTVPPTVPIVTNVMDYGAVGDGVTDDSNAILK